MSTTDTLDPNEVAPSTDYTIVAWARGHDVLLYETYGSYQGEWLMFARDRRTREYFIYKGWYGSCSGCDSAQATFDDYGLEERGGYTRASKIVQEFVKDYPPFIEIPRDTATALATNGTLETVFPANLKDEYGSEVDLPAFARDASAHIKLIESVPFTVDEVWAIPNMELRRRAWEAYGCESFVRDAGMIEVHRDGEDALVCAPARGNEQYLYLKDSSTPRRYLLRVPPEMERVREAKAWTFDLSESDYAPVIET